MKKVFFISAVLALMLCGCTVKDEITQENAENYLSQLYNRKFSLSDSYENNGNICYTFTDEEGVQLIMIRRDVADPPRNISGSFRYGYDTHME